MGTNSLTLWPFTALFNTDMLVLPRASMVNSLLRDKEIPCSIPSSAVGFLCSGKLFHGMYGLLGVLVFVSFRRVLSCLILGGVSYVLLTTNQPSNYAFLTYLVHRNFFYYRSLVCKLLATNNK